MEEDDQLWKKVKTFLKKQSSKAKIYIIKRNQIFIWPTPPNRPSEAAFIKLTVFLNLKKNSSERVGFFNELWLILKYVKITFRINCLIHYCGHPWCGNNLTSWNILNKFSKLLTYFFYTTIIGITKYKNYSRNFTFEIKLNGIIDIHSISTKKIVFFVLFITLTTLPLCSKLRKNKYN